MMLFLIIGGICFIILLSFFLLSKKKEKIQVIDAVVADSNENLYHLFGHSIHIPDDFPSFEIYRHYVLDWSNHQFISGSFQQGKGFDLKSDFVKRSMELLSKKMGKTLILAPNHKIHASIKVIHRDFYATDTEVIEAIPANAFVVTKLRENEMGFSNVRLEIYRNGKNIREHVLKAWAEHGFKLYHTPNPNQVILIYSKGRINYGKALVVIDLTNGDFLFNQFITDTKRP